MKFVLKFYADETYFGGTFQDKFDLPQPRWVPLQQAMVFEFEVENGSPIVKPGMPDLNVEPVAISLRVE